MESVAALERAKRAKKEAVEQEAHFGNEIRAAIGEHAGLLLPGYRIHYKQNKPVTKVDWEGFAKACQRGDLLSKFTTPTTGNRPLLIKTAKEAKQS
jgi:hypothetical protein